MHSLPSCWPVHCMQQPSMHHINSTPLQHCTEHFVMPRYALHISIDFPDHEEGSGQGTLKEAAALKMFSGVVAIVFKHHA